FQPAQHAQLKTEPPAVLSYFSLHNGYGKWKKEFFFHLAIYRLGRSSAFNPLLLLFRFFCFGAAPLRFSFVPGSARRLRRSKIGGGRLRLTFGLGHIKRMRLIRLGETAMDYLNLNVARKFARRF